VVPHQEKDLGALRLDFIVASSSLIAASSCRALRTWAAHDGVLGIVGPSSADHRRMFSKPPEDAPFTGGIIMSIIGALIVLFIYGK